MYGLLSITNPRGTSVLEPKRWVHQNADRVLAIALTDGPLHEGRPLWTEVHFTLTDGFRAGTSIARGETHDGDLTWLLGPFAHLLERAA